MDGSGGHYHCPRGLRKREGARGGAGVYQSCAPLLCYKKGGARILLIARALLPNAGRPPLLHATVCGETVVRRGRRTLLLAPG